MKKRIDTLKSKITSYISRGGDIYAPKRELPYYDYLSDTVKAIRKKTGHPVTHEDVYQLCGIAFDRDYNDFLQFVNDLKPFSKNHCVDAIRSTKVKSSVNVYERLKNYSDKYKTTPFDFLVLMTGYKFEECNIKTDDYEATLKYLLDCAYPNKNLSGIKRKHPNLYEQLRELQMYYPTPISMKNLVENLGFEWEAASNLVPKAPNADEVISQLRELYPDGVVEKIATTNPNLYHQIVRISRIQKVSIGDWFKENGFSYPNATKSPQLGMIKVDATKREKLLLLLKRRALERMNITTSDPIELFRASLEASTSVIEFINSTPTVDILKITDKMFAEDQLQA